MFVRKIIWWLLFSFLWLNLLLVTVFVIIVITLFYTTSKYTTRKRYFSHRVLFLIWYDILVIFTSFVRRICTKKMERWIKILKRSSTRQFMRQDRSLFFFCLLVSSVFLNSFWLIDCTRVNFDFTPWGKKNAYLRHFVRIFWKFSSHFMTCRKKNLQSIWIWVVFLKSFC